MAKRTTTIEDAILSDDEAGALKAEIGFKLRVGKNFWRPAHMRMDYWASMYFLLDPIQQVKPLGYRRFISNEPRTSVDAAVSILTRNDSFWRIEQMEDPTIGKEERRTIGKIERLLKGVVDDADELFSMRGQPKLWRQVAQQALLRGWVWGKFHVTNSALMYRPSPLVSTIYDSRTVYPKYDQWGLQYVLIETTTTLGDLAVNFPDIFPEYVQTRGSKWDPNAPAVMIEYWSNDRIGLPGTTGVLAIVSPANDKMINTVTLGTFFDNPLADNADSGKWIIHPYRHGYTPAQLPVVGVAVNGLKIDSKPVVHPLLASRLEERADLLAIQQQTWVGPGTWQADAGRSILSAVEDQVPQYNELVATVMHHFGLSAYGTWVFNTPTGAIPNFEPGIEGKIALRPEEKVSRVEIAPINADAFRLMDVLKQEKEKGVLSSVLQASSGFQGTGVLFQQVANAALNAVEPYHDGMEAFGTAAGSSILEQIIAAADSLEPFEVVAQTRSHSTFRIEFDPANDLDANRKYKPVPVFKPALPDDLSIRINAARLALDPRRPILSLKYVLENILQVDDAQGEMDALWEDLANSDPIIVLEQMADALDRMGEMDIAARLRQSEFRAKFQEDAQWRQLSGQMPGLGGGGGDAGGLNLPPEAGGGQFNAQQNGQGDEGALAAQGASILGSMGQRGGV